MHPFMLLCDWKRQPLVRLGNSRPQKRICGGAGADGHIEGATGAVSLSVVIAARVPQATIRQVTIAEAAATSA